MFPVEQGFRLHIRKPRGFQRSHCQTEIDEENTHVRTWGVNSQDLNSAEFTVIEY